MGTEDTMVPNSGPWSLFGQSVSYIIKLAPILWWALPAGSAVPHPESPNASTYAWLPDILVRAPGGPKVSKEAYNSRHDSSGTIAKMCNSVCSVV
ncbi:hypothetical protein DSO57_1036159 [Entomophthora muscae]|uniref:Uncharacterized protein n=1 Tax=Entomophthora muscae TaxID=34485 RepID=A0ACC2SZC7_9FUNG|nr:hypothetical protein DSO57_1036159 [Entomophthora muscae]